MIDLGTVRPGTTLYIPFDSFAAATGASSALSNFAVGDILIYKDGNTTARASTTGFTATTSFSSVTGINLVIIDLSSDATGDFFKAGSRYFVVVSPVTIDTQTVAFVAATFDIGYPGAVLNTSIATLASQTSFTLTAGPAEDDALNGMWAVVHDKASAVQLTWVQILDYTGSTKTVTLAAVPPATFTIAAIDNFSVMATQALQPTVTGTRLDVSAGGEAGVDWANVGTPGSTVGLTATTVATVTTTATATNVTTVNGLAANVITAASIASDADTEIANAVWDADATGHQTGGTFGQAIGDPAADTNTIFKAVVTDATAATVGLDVVDLKTQIGTAGAGLTAADDAVIAAIPSAGTVAAAVWDLDATGHQTGGTFGQAIGDPAADTHTIYDAVVTAAAGVNVAADIIAIKTVVDDIPTNAELATALAAADDAVLAAIAALNNLSAAAVNAEVVDALSVDDYAQPGQGTPPATTNLALMLAFLYKSWRNKTEQTASQYSLYNDDAATVDQKASFADDATTATRGEMVTGP